MDEIAFDELDIVWVTILGLPKFAKKEKPVKELAFLVGDPMEVYVALLKKDGTARVKVACLDANAIKGFTSISMVWVTDLSGWWREKLSLPKLFLLKILLLVITAKIRIKIKTKTKMTRARMIRTMMVLPMLTKLKMATLIKMMVEILHYLKMMMIMILALLASCVVPYLPPPGTQHKTLSRFGLYQEVQRRFVDFRGITQRSVGLASILQNESVLTAKQMVHMMLPLSHSCLMSQS